MRERDTLNRRTFLKGSALVPLVGVVGGGLLARPAGAARNRAADDPVKVAIIGFGVWGREIAATLARIPELNVAAVVDTYDVMLKRAERAVPDAAAHADYRAVLDDPEIQSVLIATPTHLHAQIAIDALAAGKHVYVEAPMAHSIEDARRMSEAAMAASKQIFQVGLLYRSNPQYRSVFQFIRSGALGKATMARAQWHSKESWRRASPNRERELEQNWRLNEEVSLGLVGEVGTQQLDPATWLLGGLPTAITGFGQIMLWDDGRSIPDTIQAIYRFDNGVHLIYDATLTSSFDDAYEMYYGRDSTIMMRDSKAWMFKEVDAPMVGWEVYARKDTFYREKGITLAANATKLDAQNVDPAADDPNVETPLWYALKEFADNHFFGPYPPAAGYQEGFNATVIAAKSVEAIRGNKTVDLEASWFEV